MQVRDFKRSTLQTALEVLQGANRGSHARSNFTARDPSQRVGQRQATVTAPATAARRNGSPSACYDGTI